MLVGLRLGHVRGGPKGGSDWDDGPAYTLPAYRLSHAWLARHAACLCAAEGDTDSARYNANRATTFASLAGNVGGVEVYLVPLNDMPRNASETGWARVRCDA